MPKEEYKTTGGIIIAQAANVKQINTIDDNRPMLVRVLLVGEGYYDDDSGEAVSLDSKPGDIVMVGKLSVGFMSSFGPILFQEGTRVGKIRESEIQFRYSGQEGYEACGKAFNEGLKL